VDEIRTRTAWPADSFRPVTKCPVRAVRRLAEDPALRDELRAGGRETAARFSQAAFEQRVVDALEDEARTSLPAR
jgi:hypothetical protein